ncbi:MAG TPA: class I SAM-dependent methyltransferase [Nitrospira sp.]
MIEEKALSYSYQAARDFYRPIWPKEAKPYLHLEPYVRCWFDPESMFGGKRVLELGAGECTYTRLIADRFRPRKIVGHELFVERMLPAVRANQNPALCPVAGDCYSLPFRPTSFDVVFASLVLSELPGLTQVLAEVARVMVPGGVFLSWDPNPYNPVMLYRYVVKGRSANQYLFWPHRVKPAFAAAGFDVETRFFYARLPRVRSRFLGTCVGMLGRKRS